MRNSPEHAPCFKTVMHASFIKNPLNKESSLKFRSHSSLNSANVSICGVDTFSTASTKAETGEVLLDLIALEHKKTKDRKTEVSQNDDVMWIGHCHVTGCR
jgi:hypothetical protein